MHHLEIVATTLSKSKVPRLITMIGSTTTAKKVFSEYNNLKVIISGGDSNFLYGKIKNTIFTNSNFIYKGLNFLIEHNQVNE